MTTQPAIDANALQAIGLFGALPGDTLMAWLGHCAVKDWQADAVVYTAGSAGRSMFVVLEGEVTIGVGRDDGTVRQVARVDAGGWFGETAMVTMHDRHDRATTRTACRLLELTCSDLARLYRTDLKAYALFVMNLTRQCARRLRQADVLLAEHTDHGVDRNGS